MSDYSDFDEGRGSSFWKTAYVEQSKQKLRQSAVNVSGTTQVISMGTPPLGTYWFIERVFVHSSAAYAVGSEPHAYILVGDAPGGGIDFTAGMDYTAKANDDISDENKPMFVQPGEEVKVRFTGLTVGDNLSVNMQISLRRPVQVRIPTMMELADVERVLLVE